MWQLFAFLPTPSSSTILSLLITFYLDDILVKMSFNNNSSYFTVPIEHTPFHLVGILLFKSLCDSLKDSLQSACFMGKIPELIQAPVPHLCVRGVCCHCCRCQLTCVCRINCPTLVTLRLLWVPLIFWVLMLLIFRNIIFLRTIISQTCQSTSTFLSGLLIIF